MTKAKKRELKKILELIDRLAKQVFGIRSKFLELEEKGEENRLRSEANKKLLESLRKQLIKARQIRSIRDNNRKNREKK